VSDTQAPPIGALLQLSAMQIEVALQAAESQVMDLSDAVASLAQLAADLPPAVRVQANAIAERTRAAMMAMQFHDQLMQRLAHVRDALTDMQRALAESHSSERWQRTLATVRGRLSMEDERLLFDRMLAQQGGNAGPVGETAADNARGAIELF
jgi:hypothetical protein